MWKPGNLSLFVKVTLLIARRDLGNGTIFRKVLFFLNTRQWSKFRKTGRVALGGLVVSVFAFETIFLGFKPGQGRWDF
jgi:hypothetical protein